MRAWKSPLAATAVLTGVFLMQAAPDTWAAFVTVGVAGMIPYTVTVACLEAWPQIGAKLRRWLGRLPVTKVK